MNRRTWGGVVCAGVMTAAFSGWGDVAKWDPAMAVKTAVVTNGVKWIDGKCLPIEGRAFDDVDHYYDRLPKNVTKKVNEGVRAMKHYTSGMIFRFSTDSTKLTFRWIPLPWGDFTLDHMPSSGTSGIDVYRFDAKRGKWMYVKTGRIMDAKKGGSLTIDWTPGTPCLVNLPIYNGIKLFELGIDPEAKIAALGPRKSGIDKPVVFYGTSITHGGCCSRPGLSFVNWIGRDLDVPVVNLGFSGSGRMEFEMSEHLANIDASCYVLDCLWNMKSVASGEARKDSVEENYEPFIRNLRAKRPDVPIVMAESSDVYFGECPRSKHHQAKDRVVKALFKKLRAEGWKNLYWLPKDGMYSGDFEGTVDGNHPNDLGMQTLKNAFGKAVGQALGLVREDECASKVMFTRQRLFPGYDGKMCKIQPSIATDGKGTVLLTWMNLLLTGSDVFYGESMAKSVDGGKTFSPGVDQKIMADTWEGKIRTAYYGNVFYSRRHGRWFGLGAAQRYKNDEEPLDVAPDGKPVTSPMYYAVDPEKGAFVAKRTLDVPFEFCGALPFGQTVECENGDWLVPFYVRPPKKKWNSCYCIIVRYRFTADGLEPVHAGTPLADTSYPRGIVEPSLAKLGDKYYLTLRTDVQGIWAESDDGMTFAKPQPWRWDDGSLLENYNTQQHWLRPDGALYLAYTRKGAHNDHVFRHRAPIFMAKFDPVRKCLIRSTEVVLVPELGARLGNFNVIEPASDEAWLITAEWMQSWKGFRCEDFGSDNSLWLARVKFPPLETEKDQVE